MTVLLGTLWSSIKQIEAPYRFDCENAIALDKIGRASCRERDPDFTASSGVDTEMP